MDRACLAYCLAPDVIPSDLLHVPTALSNGMITRDKNNRNLITAIYELRERRRFILAMKIAKGGHEVWVSTFYRAAPRQTKSVLRRGNLIRTPAIK
jgi:hypothetical protein